ncbi:hypothetical protein [Cerasicoccus frondis]|uniref:hypothetical protein n=1 Tax=Cerasicoccus frondis TaxID=490090 RepID=UPI002852659F|nr:hypothetical protein [Cerasicoccus frondis]
MRSFLTAVSLFCVASAYGVGQAWVGILPDYVVVGITRIGDDPADVVIESATGQSMRRQVGGRIDGFDIEDVIRLQDEWFVEVCRDGVEYLFACKRPQEAPFVAGPLADAFNAGLIGRDGRLTSLGRNAIAENLLVIANAGQSYALNEGAHEVDFGRLAESGHISGKQLKSLVGEDYSGIIVSDRGGAIMVRTVFGEVVRWAY